MNKFRETQAGGETQKDKKEGGSLFAAILNGSFLTRDVIVNQLPYLAFIGFMLILYIYNGYQSEKTIRELYKADTELKELKSQYTTTFSKLETMRQQSNVAQKIASVGLVESRVPPKKIVVEK